MGSFGNNSFEPSRRRRRRRRRRTPEEVKTVKFFSTASPHSFLSKLGTSAEPCKFKVKM